MPRRSLLTLAVIGVAAGCGAPRATPTPPPTSAPAADANRAFHTEYDRLLDGERTLLGNARPFVVLTGGNLTLRYRGATTSWPLLSSRYHTLKSISHVGVGVAGALLAIRAGAPDGPTARRLDAWKRRVDSIESDSRLPPIEPELVEHARHLYAQTRALLDEALTHGRPDDARLRAYGRAIRPAIAANLAAAAGALLDAVDRAMRAARDAVSPDDWRGLLVLVSTSHQARARETTVQYFERLLGERASEGASGEDRLVVTEGVAPAPAADASRTMAAHLVDRRISELLFDDPGFLQRDALAAFAGPHLERLRPEGWAAAPR